MELISGNSSWCIAFYIREIPTLVKVLSWTEAYGAELRRILEYDLLRLGGTDALEITDPPDNCLYLVSYRDYARNVEPWLIKPKYGVIGESRSKHRSIWSPPLTDSLSVEELQRRMSTYNSWLEEE